MHGGDGDTTFIVFGRLKTFDGDDGKISCGGKQNEDD
jgi:hypothetical protein